MKRDRILEGSLALITAAVFIVAGTLKIVSPVEFARDIAGYRLLPILLLTLVAAILPAVEIVAGIAMLLPRARGGAALLILCLVLAFMAATVTALLRGLDPMCGCFGAASGRVGLVSISIEVLLLGAVAAILWLRRVVQE
ncbi:MAG: DoxX family protein [Planctomycetes bacterium]|nr:DoxX family protein [Planctomycetota bacterium]